MSAWSAPWFSIAAALLLLSFLAALLRVALGPTEADRMLAAQLFGTTGVAIVLLLAYATQDWAILDVAMVMAVLAVVAVVAFVQRTRAPAERDR
jgi:multicomponent Na+:H+ antiporter subunit F